MAVKGFHRDRAVRLLALGVVTVLACCAAAQAAIPGGATAASDPQRAVVTVGRGFNLSCYDAIPMTVFVDGRPISLLGVGQMVTLHVLPGRYRIGVAMGTRGRARGALGTVAVNMAAHGSARLMANLGPNGSAIRATDP